MAVVAAVRFWAILLSLLLQSNMSHSIECFYCNTRDHNTCDQIMAGQRQFIRRCPTGGTCSTIKGQYNFDRTRKLILWRGCGVITSCAQDRSMCCHCGKSGCNYGNDCFDASKQANVYDKLYVMQLILLSITFNVIIVHILS